MFRAYWDQMGAKTDMLWENLADSERESWCSASIAAFQMVAEGISKYG